jgi:hypothetical protein
MPHGDDNIMSELAGGSGFHLVLRTDNNYLDCLILKPPFEVVISHSTTEVVVNSSRSDGWRPVP